jgi:DNA-directed RNA polymerase sigma subunit (sigma70/sigma32)
VHVDEQVGRLWRVNTRLLELLGRGPADGELADELDMSVDKVVRLKDLAQAVTSLETPVGEDGAFLGDFLEDDSAVGPDELVVRAAASRRLQRARRPSSREAAAIPAAVAPSRAAKSTARLPGRPSSSWRRALTS